MTKALHIFSLNDTAIFPDVKTWVIDKEGKILFADPEKNIFICELAPAEMPFADKLLVINNPHPELLLAFFNLLEVKPQKKQLLIKSTSIISLLDFYQNLLANHSWRACEIISTENFYYGLLVDGEEDFVLLSGIDVQILDAHHSIVYQ